jgi:hypothetical protein
MSNIILDDEINRLIFLCTRIEKTASDIRFIHLTNISYSNNNIQSCYETLLSMAENIEGSAILLESLLNMEKKKSTRICYSKYQLLQLREHVTETLSNQIGSLLRQVVEREANNTDGKGTKSWRDIRTILMK